jgi:hypothetical protein
MDEFVGDRRIHMNGIIVEAIPGKRIVWQLKKGVRLPSWLRLDLVDDGAGVSITHTIQAGFSGPGRILDPLLRIYFSKKFAAAMDAHVRTEFPKLRDMLATKLPSNSH